MDWKEITLLSDEFTRDVKGGVSHAKQTYFAEANASYASNIDAVFAQRGRSPSLMRTRPIHRRHPSAS